MKEDKLLGIIESIIGNEYIGDDCAHLKELGIVVSQDSLVEDIHFSMDYITPFQLGFKSAMVNISDIAASGGKGKYLTVALSLPKTISEDFVKEFYLGLKQGCDNIEIIGGDITGSDKIMVSITVIGTTTGRRISSRSHAKTKHVIVTSGVHGSSACGLRLLQTKSEFSDKEQELFITPHLTPVAQVEFAKNISENIKQDYAMMDSSDGLADCLFKIAQASNKTLVVDFNKIPFQNEIRTLFPDEYKDLILFGGEDYQIVATIPEELANSLKLNVIGYVDDRDDDIPVKILNYDTHTKIITDLNSCYNHFE